MLIFPLAAEESLGPVAVPVAVVIVELVQVQSCR